MPIASNLTQEAVAMLKQNAHPDGVVARLVALGADPVEAQAHVAELVRLKQQAEAPPVDASLLRQEVWQMMMRRVHIEEIVAYLGRYGVADAHARAEVHRLAAMKPCEMCGTPMARGTSFYNRLGAEICRRCNTGEEIRAQENRVVEAELEARGVPLHAIQKDNQVVWCPRCQDLTGVLAHATHLVGANSYGGATRSFRCTRCGLPI